MQNVFLFFLLILIFTNCKKQNINSRETELDSISYFLGIETGEHLKKFGFDTLNLLEFENGIRKALYSDSTINATKQAKIKHAIIEYKNKVNENLNKKNKKLGLDFLNKNRKKRGVKVLKSGLQIKILHRTKNKKANHDFIYLRYTIYNIKGKQIDSSGKKAILFSKKRMIKAIQEALSLMNMGDIFRIYSPPELAFGSKYPHKKGFEPGMALIIDLELVNQ